MGRKMRLIIGGAYQGKKEYAAEEYKLEEKDWVDGAVCTEKELLESAAVSNFHIYIRRLIVQGSDPMETAQKIIEKNTHITIVTNEVGYGIVPMDAKERAWREACGRVCTVLAAKSEEVIRISCGIGQMIKGSMREKR
jgi:adenosylcobinamide kinase/adenosylcobinamide-phosphate guanylyltransferase